MIVELNGVLRFRSPGYCVVEVAGVGYGLDVPRETEHRLGGVGDAVHLYTHLIVREDGWRLVGFASPDERQSFIDVLGVSGVGVKGALALLSHLGVDGLRTAVRDGRWQRLKEAPGVGPKLAQRVVLELSGKWQASPGAVSPDGPQPGGEETGDEVVTLLVSLGYSVAEASAALKDVPEGLLPEERVREALRRLDRHKGAV